MIRMWDVQVAWHSWPLQLGFHVDHTDPSVTLHLPCLIVALGRLKQPGFLDWAWRGECWEGEADTDSEGDDG